MNQERSSTTRFDLHCDGEAGDLRHGPRMGKTPSEVQVIVRELLLQILDERSLSRNEMAHDLGIAVPTLNGLLSPTKPRSASQTMQLKIRTAYGVTPGVVLPTVAGKLGAGARVTLTTRPSMPAEVSLEVGVQELALEAGDLLRIAPHDGSAMDPGEWYVITLSDERDVLAQATTFNGLSMFRLADAPHDDLRAFLEEHHRVSYVVTAWTRMTRSGRSHAK